jgi:hypothetical protein
MTVMLLLYEWLRISLLDKQHTNSFLLASDRSTGSLKVIHHNYSNLVLEVMISISFDTALPGTPAEWSL